MTNIFEEPSSVIQLIEDIANGNVITFVGAGVSISASGNHQTASWVGLIWNCLEYCIKHKYVNRGTHYWTVI